MNILSSKKFYRNLSLYIDGKLSADEIKSFEEYLSTHHDANKEADSFRQMQKMLHDKPSLREDEWFWTRLSPRLPGDVSNTSGMLPFSRKVAPLALSLTAFVVLFVAGVIYYQRDQVSRYFSEKKAEMNEAYRDGFLKGSILPLFGNLSNDQVLQFALFGTLPLDKENQTSLRIDENANKGYRIEFTKSGTRNAPPVSVNAFCDQIGIRPDQQEIVDSMLNIVKGKIQASVLVGENNSIAIHTELVKLNQLMVSNIAASLEQDQRVRFLHYLEKNKAPYTFVAGNMPPVPSERIFNQISRPPRSDDFFVVTPDTLVISRLGLNIDSLRQHTMIATAPEINEVEARAHSLMRHLQEIEMHREHFAARMPDVEDFNLPNGDFSVTEPTQGNNALVVKVVPRMQRLIVPGELEDDEHAPDSGFFFEFGRDDSVRLRFFPQIPSHVRENQRIISEPNVAFPSPAPAPSGPPSLQREQRIDLDSIFSGTPKHNRKNDVRVKSRRKGPIEL